MRLNRGISKFLVAFAAISSSSPLAANAQVTINSTNSQVTVAEQSVTVFQQREPASTPQGSQQNTDEKLAAVFKFVYDNEAKKHGWPANYESMWCPTNVFNLLRRLDEAKVDISKAQVLYIVPSYYAGKPGSPGIFPRAARAGEGGPVREWTFHVILLIEGKVLDLDFTNEPTVVEMNDYFARMFGKGPLAVQKSKPVLFIRSIPAPDYFSSYTGNWEWYVRGAGGRYPAVDLDTLFAPALALPAAAGF